MSGLIDLATHETKSLDFQEATIEKGRKTFVEVGKALAKIRDGKLYRETHTTFEAYCQERWGWSKSRATHFIQAADVSENLVTNVTKPTAEYQARPLTKLPAEDQPAAWDRANELAEEEGKSVTARHVEKAVEETQPKKKERLPKYTPEDADEFATTAIAQLERISDNDKQKDDALLRVIKYCNSRIN
tara:strand:+ start:44 stop:607 length:564 start_codon:yes stop_codon:yes gene_type:complete